MSTYLSILALAAAMLSAAPVSAQERSVTVGASAGGVMELLRDLAVPFRAQTGITVKGIATEHDGTSPSPDAEALLIPRRAAPEGSEQQIVFFGEGVLVGSRADRARVRGLPDIRKAFQWIASTRALYVSSSASLGLRELELQLWSEVGVNVRARLTWYTEIAGDEMAAFDQAAQFGAYMLVQRSTWAAHENRRGLEILVQGDPALRTSYVSHLLRTGLPEAQAWHEWLSSDAAQTVISAWRLNGVEVFTPARKEGTSGALPPRG